MKNQIPLFKRDLRFFGGQLLLGKRKGLRPLSSKEPIHMVLRSSWAQGRWSFLRPQNKAVIASYIQSLAKKYGVRVYRTAIQSNHLHLVLKIESRRSYKAFIRVLSAKIAMHVMKRASFQAFQENRCQDSRTEQNKKFLAGDGGFRDLRRPQASAEPQGKGQKFWQFRPFTRVLTWGKDFKQCCHYVVQNILEATGFSAYKPRKNHYAQWLPGDG